MAIKNSTYSPLIFTLILCGIDLVKNEYFFVGYINIQNFIAHVQKMKPSRKEKEKSTNTIGSMWIRTTQKHKSIQNVQYGNNENYFLLPVRLE